MHPLWPAAGRRQAGPGPGPPASLPVSQADSEPASEPPVLDGPTRSRFTVTVPRPGKAAGHHDRPPARVRARPCHGRRPPGDPGRRPPTVTGPGSPGQARRPSLSRTASEPHSVRVSLPAACMSFIASAESESRPGARGAGGTAARQAAKISQRHRTSSSSSPSHGRTTVEIQVTVDHDALSHGPSAPGWPRPRRQ